MSDGYDYRFADCALDTQRRELRVGNTLVAVEPKVFDFIEYLVIHRDRVVTKSELQEHLWANVVVTEASLSRTVMKARKALRDTASNPRIIRTVPRRGFRFVAELSNHVEPVDAAVPGLSDVRFVSSNDVHIAWRTLGTGSEDILFAPGFVSHLEARYRIGQVARFDQALAAGRRLITFDKRSVGLSDRIGKPPRLEDTVRDMTAVLDAAGSKRTAIFAVCESGPAACVFAAQNPDRVSHLILYGSFAKGVRSADYTVMPDAGMYRAWLENLIAGWGGPTSLELFAPSLADEMLVRKSWAQYLRSAASPGTVRGILESLLEIDVRDELAAIRCPTLVVHCKGDRMIRASAGSDLAERIPGAELVLLEGNDHWWFTENATAVVQAARPFLDRPPQFQQRTA